MVLDRFSPQIKYVIVLCCILLVVAAVLFVIGFNGQMQKTKHGIQVHLVTAAENISRTVNGDGLGTLKPGDEGSPLYLSFARTLYAARSSDPDLSGAYILREDNGTFGYVIDDAYIAHGPGPTVARIGNVATADLPVLAAARYGAVYSPDIYTSGWGSYMSGYAPVKDSNGTVVGILGVDETSDTVIHAEYSGLFQLVEVM